MNVGPVAIGERAKGVRCESHPAGQGCATGRNQRQRGFAVGMSPYNRFIFYDFSRCGES